MYDYCTRFLSSLIIFVSIDIFFYFQSYRAYKWATKVPHCASQILCTINEKSQQDDGNESRIRSGLLKVASFPAAWGVSHKLGINFWSLYGAITENEGCIVSKLRLTDKKF